MPIISAAKIPPANIRPQRQTLENPLKTWFHAASVIRFAGKKVKSAWVEVSSMSAVLEGVIKVPLFVMEVLLFVSEVPLVGVEVPLVGPKVLLVVREVPLFVLEVPFCLTTLITDANLLRPSVTNGRTETPDETPLPNNQCPTV